MTADEGAPEDRYARHALIEWWSQRTLRESCVMVVGAGALGNEVLKLLALIGLGTVVVVDFDTIEITNLTRGILFRDADIGHSKAETAARRMREINPDTHAYALHADVEFDVGLGVFRSVDLVIGCLDTVQARLAVNLACRRAGVPWINGGIEATLGEVSLFSGSEGPCFECEMSPAMWEHGNRRYSCGGLRAPEGEDRMPTTAVVASVIAGIMVNEALFVLHADTGAGKAGLAFGEKVYLVLKPYNMHVLKLPYDPACLAHVPHETVTLLDCAAASTTVAALLGRFDGDAVLDLGFDLLTEMRCTACGAAETILKPAARCSLDLAHCPQCGERASRQPETLSSIGADSPYAGIPLAALSVPRHAVLSVRSSDNARSFQLDGDYVAGGVVHE